LADARLKSGSWRAWDKVWVEFSAGHDDSACLFVPHTPRTLLQFWQQCYADDLLRMIRDGDFESFLELGSGRGTTSMYLSAAGFSNITLVDLSATALGLAAGNFERFGLPVPKRLVADVQSTGLPAESCDVIYNIGLLEHFEDVAPVLAESYRLLAPGGLIFMPIVPEMPRWKGLLQIMILAPFMLPLRWARSFIKRRPAQPAAFRALTNRGEYAAKAAEAGFCQVSCVPYNPYWNLTRLGGHYERAIVVPMYRLHRRLRGLWTSESLKTSPLFERCYLLSARKGQPRPQGEPPRRESSAVSVGAPGGTQPPDYARLKSSHGDGKFAMNQTATRRSTKGAGSMLEKYAARALNIPQKSSLYFYYTARPHWANPIHQMRLHYQGASIAHLKSSHKELFKLLIQLIAAAESTGCEFGDYLEIYNTVRKLKPKYILECGSGISSLVFAFALRENEAQTGTRGKLVSMDESPFYHEQVKSIFPESFAEYVEFVLSPRSEKQYGGSWGAYYQSVPSYPYEFVFVDGPTVQSRPGSRVCFNADLINVLLASADDHTVDALVDQRINTYRHLRKLIPHARVHYNPIKKLTRVYGASKASLARCMLENDAATKLSVRRCSRDWFGDSLWESLKLP
jgi:ubiquinone/menaquinone biosynthesis C-methylase UbiE